MGPLCALAVYLPKPQRGSLYPASAPGDPPHPTAAAASPAQLQPLPPAPNRSQLRGTWALSKGTATLTAALSEEAQGEFQLRVRRQVAGWTHMSDAV